MRARRLVWAALAFASVATAGGGGAIGSIGIGKPPPPIPALPAELVVERVGPDAAFRAFGQHHHVAVSPDGERLLTGGPKGGTLWDLATGARLAALTDEEVGFVGFSADGNPFWARGREYARLVGEGRPQVSCGSLSAAAIAHTPDGLVLGCGTRVLVEGVERAQVEKPLEGLASNGRVAVGWARYEKKVTVLDLKKGAAVATLEGPDRPKAAAVAPDGTVWLSFSLTKGLYRWSGRELERIDIGREGNVVALAFGPDGALAVRAVRGLQIRDGDRVRCEVDLPDHAAFGGVAWTPDGTGIVTGVWGASTEGSAPIRVDARTCTPLGVPDPIGAPRHLLWTRDGWFVGGEGEVAVWGSDGVRSARPEGLSREPAAVAVSSDGRGVYWMSRFWDGAPRQAVWLSTLDVAELRDSSELPVYELVNIDGPLPVREPIAFSGDGRVFARGKDALVVGVEGKAPTFTEIRDRLPVKATYDSYGFGETPKAEVHDPRVVAVALDADGSKVAMSVRYRIRRSDGDRRTAWWVGVLDRPTGRITASGTSDLQRIALSSDGKLLAGAPTIGIVVHDTATGSVHHYLEAPRGDARVLRWFPDNRRLLAASDRALDVHDAVTGERLAHFDTGQGGVVDVAFDNAGRLGVLGRDGTILVLDVAAIR